MIPRNNAKMTTHGDQCDVIGARPVRIRQAGAAPGSEQAVRDHRSSAGDSFVHHHCWFPGVVTGEQKEEEDTFKRNLKLTSFSNIYMPSLSPTQSLPLLSVHICIYNYIPCSMCVCTSN